MDAILQNMTLNDSDIRTLAHAHANVRLQKQSLILVPPMMVKQDKAITHTMCADERSKHEQSEQAHACMNEANLTHPNQ